MAVLIASVVGSTGLAGLITGGVQFTRASRVKKAVTDMATIVKILEPSSVEHGAASYALKVLTLDLVALRVVRINTHTWWIIFGLVVTGVGTTLISGVDWVSELAEGDWTSTLLAMIVTYIVIAVGAFVFFHARRREKLVALLLEDDVFDDKAVVAFLPSLQTRQSKAKMQKLKGQGPDGSSPEQ